MNIKLNRFLKTNLLTILTVAGVVAGIALGFILRSSSDEKWTQREVVYLNFIGDLFLRALRALILPLIVSSLIAAIGSLDLSLSRKIGIRAIIYYLSTTVLAVILGIILVVFIQPGVGNSFEELESSSKVVRNVTTVDTLMDLVRNMFPPNVVQACFEQFQTILVPPADNPNEFDRYKWKITEDYAKGTNILGLVIVSCIFGITLSIMGQEVKMLLKICLEFSHAMMKITRWIIWLSPIGVLFLIAAKLVEMDDLEAIIGKLGFYFLTVTCGVLLHGFVILPFIFFIATRKNPYIFISNMGQAIATAFGTSSSSASLPVTMQCLEDNNNVDPRVSRFVLPIGATINMDGTALYEAVAAIFIAQIRNVPLSFGNIVAISITATAASIGAAGIPQAGLVTMVMVLDTVGLPAEDVSLIIAVDWLLDRIRTVINVLGDSLGAGIVAHLSRNELEQQIEDKELYTVNEKNLTSSSSADNTETKDIHETSFESEGNRNSTTRNPKFFVNKVCQDFDE